MAKINDKDINDLSTWTMKELRKLKINCKNRIQALEINSKAKISNSNLLLDLEIGELQQIVLKIHRAEKVLANQ